jgi:hypothetical protein
VLVLVAVLFVLVLIVVVMFGPSSCRWRCGHVDVALRVGAWGVVR